MKNKMDFMFTARDCIERINVYIAGMDFSDFEKDIKTQDAVLRNIEILGGALKDYGIDISIIWNTVKQNVFPLEGILLEVIKNEK